MSRIFDALKRSEAEYLDRDLGTPLESITDLLHAAEGRRVQQKLEVLPAPAWPEAFSLSAAQVLRSSPPADARLVCLTEPGSLGAEKFRALGLRLHNIRDTRKLKRIVVTGTAPEEGKSLIAANLALNQARSRSLRTLLVDGDFRRPTLAGRFGVGALLPGLSEALRGQHQLAEVVYKLDGCGLWLLPAGMAPENPLDLMQSGRLAEFLAELETVFDWIIIDAPPLFPLADTTFWMKLSDGVVLVVREGVTEKKMLQRAVESIDRSNLLGVVINSFSSIEHKYYYSRYGRAAMQPGQPTPPRGKSK